MAWLDSRLREGNRFFAMLGQQAARTVEAIAFLEEALARPDAPAVARLRVLAGAASEQRRVLIDELHQTFVTPIDREDLFNLSHSYEGMVKYALATLDELHLFGVDADAPIRDMVRLMREQTEELARAIERLPRNPRVAEDHATTVHAKEREVERIYRDAILALFARATEPAELPKVLYRREVYRHISNMVDRADEAARTLGMVVMKLA
jgi:uncharacterized protein Yka (UPF0111/DUF47 family)